MSESIFDDMFKEKKTISKKDPPISIKREKKVDYEKFIRRNLDMLKEALDESIKQYRNKKDDKSGRRVIRYKKIYEKLLKIEEELEK